MSLPLVNEKPTDNSLQTLISLDQIQNVRVTSLAQFLQCPRRWQAQVLGKEPRRESKWSTIGTAVHLMCEAYLRGEFDLFTPEANEWLQRMEAAGVNDKERRNLLTYLQSLSDYRGRVVALEFEFELPTFPESWRLKGHIDALIATDDGLIILDHKTNRSFEGVDAWSRKTQQIAYAWAVRQMLPRTEKLFFEIGYVNQGTKVRWETDPKNDIAFEAQVVRAWEEFQVYRRHNEFPERLNADCGYCGLLSECHTWKDSLSRLLPPEAGFINREPAETLTEQYVGLDILLKAGKKRLGVLEEELIERVREAGGEHEESGYRAHLYSSSRRQVDARTAWDELATVLSAQPSLGGTWDELLDEVVTFKVGGLEALAKQNEAFAPLMERAVSKVTVAEPSLKLAAIKEG